MTQKTAFESTVRFICVLDRPRLNVQQRQLEEKLKIVLACERVLDSFRRTVRVKNQHEHGDILETPQSYTSRDCREEQEIS